MSENEKLMIEAILASIGLEPLKVNDPKTHELKDQCSE